MSVLDDRFADWVASGEETRTRTTIAGWRNRVRELDNYFPDGDDAGPALSDADQALDALRWYAEALNLHGFPGRSVGVYEQHDKRCRVRGLDERLATSLAHHGKTLRQIGRFRDGDRIALEAQTVQRRVGNRMLEAVNLAWYGIGLAHRGEAAASDAAFDEAMAIFTLHFADQSRGVVAAFRAQRALWLGEPDVALAHAVTAWEIARPLELRASHHDSYGARKVTASAARLRGESLVLLHQHGDGIEWLERAHSLAAEAVFVEELIPIQRALTISALERNDLADATGHAAAALAMCDAGPYRPYSAEVHLLRADIAKRSGDDQRATEALDTAQELAFCDGPPFAYQRVLDDVVALRA